MNEYDKQAEQFLKSTNTTMKVVFHKYDYYFDGDRDRRNIYKITLKRKGIGQYTFTFGTSLNDTWNHIEPNAYDVLACIEKYDPESFEYFCDSYGYDTDSRKAEKIYKECLKQYKNVYRLFSDVLEQLREIQ